MKKCLFLFVLAIVWSCSSPLETELGNESPELIQNFLIQTKSLEDADLKKPIQAFTKAADSSFAEKMVDTKTNMKEVLKRAEAYAYCVLVTEDHTLVKFSDTKDCKSSGSWGVCMPMGEGYIKKGDLEFQKDYINNIIGLPDDQKRMAYFFN